MKQTFKSENIERTAYFEEFYLFENKQTSRRNRHEAGSKQSPLPYLSWFHLFFDPEDRGDMFLRNVC
jgi:hypothetical protein